MATGATIAASQGKIRRADQTYTLTTSVSKEVRQIGPKCGEVSASRAPGRASRLGVKTSIQNIDLCATEPWRSLLVSRYAMVAAMTKRPSSAVTPAIAHSTYFKL